MKELEIYKDMLDGLELIIPNKHMGTVHTRLGYVGGFIYGKNHSSFIQDYCNVVLIQNLLSGLKESNLVTKK